MKIAVIRPYKLGSKSAKLLAQSLSNKLGYGARCVSTAYIPRRNEFVINWGSSKDYYKDSGDANHTTEVATNKLETFKRFKMWRLSHPEWTTSISQAAQWVESGELVLARLNLTGSGGRGIVICSNNQNPLANAPLYVKYKKKKKEFRVHVVKGKVIEVVEKRKRKGFENFNTQIRNHSNGWVFCRENVSEPNDLRLLAISAVAAVGLDFGAVDVIWNEKENKCYVLEVNSAPGIEGTTVEQYSNAFVEMLSNA